MTNESVFTRNPSSEQNPASGNGAAQAEPTVLVLGATGKTGSRVARRLRERGGMVRSGSRSARPPFDWERTRTWGPVLDGADAVYVVYSPDLGVPGADERIRDFTEAAAAHGVRRLVLLSGRGEDGARRAEQALREVAQARGMDWTVLRCAWFCQVFSEDFLLEGVRSGTVVLPAEAVAEPFVDVGDIADVAVAALLDDGHAGRVYDVTGPHALTLTAVTAEIAAATGRVVEYVPSGPRDYAAMLAEHLPSDMAEWLAEMFATVLDGRNAVTGDGVREALGREARPFGEVVREIAATGVWDEAVGPHSPSGTAAG